MIGSLITFLLIGLVAGGLARLLVPGKDPMSMLGTIALGCVGSFVGGFFGFVLSGADTADGMLQTSGLLFSVLGAIAALLAYRAWGSHTTHA